METTIYNQEGKESGKITLPEAVFGLPWNADLVHSVVTVMEGNARIPVAHTKGRGDVRGGGRKPWRQKGTGRARHGSSRSPIWIGGGVTHGPTKDRNYKGKVNKKASRKALLTTISQKFRDDQMLFVDKLSIISGKTKDASKILGAFSGISGFEKIAYKTGKRALFVVPKNDRDLYLPFRNIKTIDFEEVGSLSPIDVLGFGLLVVVDPQKVNDILLSKTNAKHGPVEAAETKKDQAV